MKEPKPILILVGLTILLIFILYFTLSILQPKNDCDIKETHYHDDELYYIDTIIETSYPYYLEPDTFIRRQKHYPSENPIIDTFIIRKRK